VPHLSRIAPDTWLLPADPALPGWHGSALRAGRIAQLARVGRSRMTLVPAGPGRGAELVAAARVRLPVTADTAGRPVRGTEFLLLGVGRGAGPWPAELWLTDLAEPGPLRLLGLVGLGRRVERTGMARAEQVGIRDFVGRSFAGWHRHATLASVAHAVTELAERG
jgi:hypothetical protein